jgi:hypothetical protein
LTDSPVFFLSVKVKLAVSSGETASQQQEGSSMKKTSALFLRQS